MDGVRWRKIVDGRVSSDGRTTIAYCTFRNWPDFRINTPRAIAGALFVSSNSATTNYMLATVDPFHQLQRGTLGVLVQTLRSNVMLCYVHANLYINYC